MKGLLFCFFLLCGFVSCKNHAPHSEPNPSRVNCMPDPAFMLVEGKYEGKNLYVLNPYLNCTDTTILFCVYSVSINDSITLPASEIRASAFEIPLTSYGFQYGQALQIKFYHYENCRPKLLNPEVR
jgi:hypothetical protein